MILKNYLKIGSAVAMLLCWSGCEKILLGTAATNDPEAIFEDFWTDFDQHYGLFEARDWNWDSIYQVQRPLVTPQTTEEELWEVLSNTIAYLDDSHTWLYHPVTERIFVSGYAENVAAEATFSRTLIGEKYLENWQPIAKSRDPRNQFAYGKLRDRDIGYIHLQSMSDYDQTIIDDAIATFENVAAIILDTRNNDGGNGDKSAYIAGAFSDGKHLVYTSQTRNGLQHNYFDAPKLHYTQQSDIQTFTKPVIVLTNRATVSAGEELIWHLKAFEHVTQIGDATAGDLSDTSNRRFLANGWQYQYSIQMYLTPTGKTLDGIGHIPDIYSLNTAADIANQSDKVLERALQFLREEYQIE